jgi:hypothetical protein
LRSLDFTITKELKQLTSKSTQILFHDCFVDCGSSADTFTIIMRHPNSNHVNITQMACMKDYARAPPVGLALDVSEYNVLDSSRHSGYFPWNISLPASPRFRKMLKNGLSLILLNRFRHHIQDVMHDSGAKLEIEMRFDPLFSHGLCNTFAVPAFELSSKKIPKPES